MTANLAQPKICVYLRLFFQVFSRGISELRIHYGPGYRIYYTIREQTIVILLCAGTKKSQDKDIKKAKKLNPEV
jgi:putative addiction module killer protein